MYTSSIPCSCNDGIIAWVSQMPSRNPRTSHAECCTRGTSVQVARGSWVTQVKATTTLAVNEDLCCENGYYGAF